MYFKESPKSKKKLDIDTLIRWYKDCVIWNKKYSKPGLIKNILDYNSIFIEYKNELQKDSLSNPNLVFNRPQIRPFDDDLFSYFVKYSNQGGQGVYKRGFNTTEYQAVIPIKDQLVNLNFNLDSFDPIDLYLKILTFKPDPDMIIKVFDKERIMGVVGKQLILSWTNFKPTPILFQAKGGHMTCKTPKQALEVIANG